MFSSSGSKMIPMSHTAIQLAKISRKNEKKL